MGIVCRIRSSSKKKGFLGLRFAPTDPTYIDSSLDSSEAEEYVASATADAETSTPDIPQYGYASLDTEAEQSSSTETEALTELENQAHSQKVLLSSDAMRYFIGKIANLEDRSSTLDRVIAKARVSFPSEDGWVVLNLVRMEQMVEEVNKEHDEIIADQEVDLSASKRPITAGSLAEAIVSGNVVAAYEMISHRPMVALADAATDLDALYRYRKGENATVSEMLKSESIKLSSEQLQNAITALTSALDGTYTDEASAVKMAIMKAIKAVA